MHCLKMLYTIKYTNKHLYNGNLALLDQKQKSSIRVQKATSEIKSQLKL